MPADQTIRGIAGKAFDGAGLRIAIVAARWNPAICDTLTAGAKETLEKAGAEVVVERVAGAYELPAAAQALQKHFDGVIAIGCLVKGETMHFEYIAEAVTHGIMRLNLDNGGGKPVIYGVLTVLNEEQAKARAGLLEGPAHAEGNSGVEWAKTCLESVLLMKKYHPSAVLDAI